MIYLHQKLYFFAISDLLILSVFRRKKVVLKFTGNAQAVRHAPSWAVFLCKVRRAGQIEIHIPGKGCHFGK